LLRNPVVLFSLVLCTVNTSQGQQADEPAARRDVVVVTGAYTPIPLEEADRTVRIFDVRSLELVTNTFADLLKLDSSIDMRQRAPNTVQSDVSIRGAGFGQTLVLLDGMRLNDVQSGHHNFDVPLPLSSIAQIEVLKGAGSTLYGSDAVGGVVNFITRRPETSEFRLRGALGNFGVTQESGRLSYSGPRLSAGVAAVIVLSRFLDGLYRESRLSKSFPGINYTGELTPRLNGNRPRYQ
jgi:iron complex outermembrane receptor protein